LIVKKFESHPKPHGFLFSNHPLCLLAGQQLMLTAGPNAVPPQANFPYAYPTAPGFGQPPVYGFNM
uniref:Uncharacterized protein n=1 Tax=Pseudonaja textilis TaxID=8673 RepID=A0A670YJ42_PSETE